MADKPFNLSEITLADLLPKCKVAKKIRSRRKAKNSEAVKVYPDGRMVCQNNSAGIAQYKAWRDEIWEKYNGLCCFCGGYILRHEATMEHCAGRGMGGGRRDDRPEVNKVAHGSCNAKAGSPKREQ